MVSVVHYLEDLCQLQIDLEWIFEVTLDADSKALGQFSPFYWQGSLMVHWNIRKKIDNFFIPEMQELLETEIIRHFLRHCQKNKTAIPAALFCLVLSSIKELAYNFFFLYLYSDRKWKILTNDSCRTLSGHFFAICVFIFHKTEVQTVILRC